MKKLFLLLSLIWLTFNACKQGEIDHSVDSLVAVTSDTNSYQIASDGELIGINGKAPETMSIDSKGVARPQIAPLAAMACGAASNLVIRAVSNVALPDGSIGCVLSHGWYTGGGNLIALFINGTIYKSSSSGYGLWPSGDTGLACEAAQVGGITAGKTFQSFVRTYCSYDTSGTHYDSPTVTYIVPSGFVCSNVTSPPPTKPPHKPHK